MNGLFDAARRCIDCTVPDAKVALTRHTFAAFRDGRLQLDPAAATPLPIGIPGRPPRPRLVAPRAVPQRGLGSAEGRAALVHAVEHTEFNAINLARDAVYRFRGMPDAYYRDWAAAVSDEARHFTLPSVRLAELGHTYGDFDAHNGLWEMAVKTADSCLARMALVPRVLEARGLDVTLDMIGSLCTVGDAATADILEITLHEEVPHVAAGTRWFRYCCAREGRTPMRHSRRCWRNTFPADCAGRSTSTRVAPPASATRSCGSSRVADCAIAERRGDGWPCVI